MGHLSSINKGVCVCACIPVFQYFFSPDIAIINFFLQYSIMDIWGEMCLFIMKNNVTK